MDINIQFATMVSKFAQFVKSFSEYAHSECNNVSITVFPMYKWMSLYSFYQADL